MKFIFWGSGITTSWHTGVPMYVRPNCGCFHAVMASWTAETEALWPATPGVSPTWPPQEPRPALPCAELAARAPVSSPRQPPCREADGGSAQVPDSPGRPSGSGQTRLPGPVPVTLSLALITVTLITGDRFSQGALAGVLVSPRSGPGWKELCGYATV